MSCNPLTAFSSSRSTNNLCKAPCRYWTSSGREREPTSRIISRKKVNTCFLRTRTRRPISRVWHDLLTSTRYRCRRRDRYRLISCPSKTFRILTEFDVFSRYTAVRCTSIDRRLTRHDDDGRFFSCACGVHSSIIRVFDLVFRWQKLFLCWVKQ